ncbi:prepilin-type N-terminal cleavage/methylation domain-containing protein [Prosthecobacter sp.]|uniref:prepilin-type N-terminal cleavage/methylation domain-containing protein n=1 Tax=Prosthecobacter sp. TaxID=1965333 RepID=UPI00248A09EC|nr:prepilin-type N-terminal cleavage/methylation domain-containing protein [Prosthecobacter sp.]MDI1312479.1 prepilin-type N-terminal cleavage/methylation domain-containing protein [Prosthecobacter sp.]
MKFQRIRFNQNGLTLLELLVVLTILVVLSTVAITSTSGVADQARYEATQRALENIREAVVGPANQRDADGSLLITGFVADMGRLPLATSEAVTGGTIFTLAELWENVNGMAAHAVRQASADYVDDDAEADAEVYLATGWRGPYLQLPPGSTSLRDGWAAELANPDGVVSGYPNALLRTQAGVDISAITEQIGQMHSFGANAAENGADTGYERDLSVMISAAQTAATEAVTIEVRNADGTPATAVPADQIIVRLFAPDPATGLITVTREEADFTASTLTLNFFPTTPGPRVLRAYYDTGNDGSIQRSSVIVPVMLRHGGNMRTIILTVP